MIRLSDNPFIKEIGWGGLDLSQRLPKELTKLMSINEEDDFLTKVVKVLYKRNLRIVSQKMDPSKMKSCVGPLAKRAFLKLWSKGYVTWNSISQNRVILTRKEIISQLGVNLTEEEYTIIRKVGSSGLGRTLSSQMDTHRTQWDKAMDFDPFTLNDNLEDFTIIDDTIFAWTDGSMCESQGAAGYGVFFKKNSPFNYYDATSGGNSIGEAELEAIEWGINKAPLLDKLIIFSDTKD